MSYIKPMRLGAFLKSFNCILCKSPITEITSGDTDDSLEMTEEGLLWHCHELYYDLETVAFPPKAFNYVQKMVKYNLSYSTLIDRELDDHERLKLKYKSFWIELNCSKCKKYSVGCVLDYNCDDYKPVAWTTVQDCQITFPELSVKNYFNNLEYSVVTKNSSSLGPVKIQRIDFNQSEDDILNEIKVQLAFM